MSNNWICPYCGTNTTINQDSFRASSFQMKIPNPEGLRELESLWIVCPNEKCSKITLSIALFKLNEDNSMFPLINYNRGDFIKEWRLLPESHAKTFPDYIPASLIKDYEEACAIVDLSPKASATLSRRCLQGIIRDFWKINKNRLIDEIEEIKDKIDPLTWNSIDAIRSIGNIGAHMEKDINLIVDIDSGEASLLIQLIELLFHDWYIIKHDREEKMNAIIQMSAEKIKLKQASK